MKTLETACRRELDRVERATCVLMAVLMAVLVLGVSFQVAGRLWLSHATGQTLDLARWLAYGQELVQYSFVWMVFLGAGVGARRGSHLRIDLIEGALGPAGRRMLSVLVDGVCLILASVFVAAGIVVAWRTRSHVSPALGLSIGAIYSVFPLSGLSLGAFLLEAIVWGRPPKDAETSGGDD